MSRLTLLALSGKSSTFNKPDTGLDHGLMGALLLLGEDRFNTDELLPCASAIALHNRLRLNPSIDKITFEKHPLAFLLLYCDLLHEWGRGEPETDRKKFLPRLNKFRLLVPWRELIDDGVDINHIEKDKRNKIKWIFASLEMEKYKNKKRRKSSIASINIWRRIRWLQSKTWRYF